LLASFFFRTSYGRVSLEGNPKKKNQKQLPNDGHRSEEGSHAAIQPVSGKSHFTRKPYDIGGLNMNFNVWRYGAMGKSRTSALASPILKDRLQGTAMLNLNHLRIFCCVAKHKSFTKAARILSISQPAVTNQVKALQESLNLRLFRKKRGEVALTEEGSILYEHSQRLFELEREIEDVVDDLKELKIGSISLGTPRSYARQLLPFLIAHFHESYPGITIRIDEGGALDVINRLLDHRNEIGIVAKVEETPGIVFRPLCRESLIVVVPPGHRLARNKTIRIEDLADEPMIMREMGSGTRKLVRGLFAARNFKPTCSIEASSTELIKTMIARGKGISIMSRPAGLPEIEKGELIGVSLEDSKAFLDINIAYLKNYHLSSATVAFLKVLDDLLPEGKPVVGIRTLIARLFAQGEQM
jgi:DNA-binding transcriptional LysR family regulator